MEFDAAFFLSVLSRWLHVLSAITAVGGTIFARLALLPSLHDVPPDERAALHDRIRRRWSKAVMAAIAFLIISGLYNFIVVNKGLSKDIKTLYHALFGTKVLLALAVFFIASALVGKSAAFEKIRANARLWLTVNLVLAVTVVCISGFMRVARDNAPTEDDEAAARPTAKWVEYT